MVAEVFAGLSAIKSAFDIAKGLKDIDDATRRNAAVIEFKKKSSPHKRRNRIWLRPYATLKHAWLSLKHGMLKSSAMNLRLLDPDRSLWR